MTPVPGQYASVMYRARLDLRSRWRVLVALAMLVGVVGGSLIASMAAARRTDSAYERLRHTTRSADLYVTGGCASSRCPRDVADAEALATAELDGVESAVPLSTYSGVFETADGRVLQEESGGTSDLTLMASWDPRYGAEIDRPVLVSGRRIDPEAPFEVVIDRELARSRDLAIGDAIDVTFNTPDHEGVDDARPPDVTVEVVGIVLLPMGVRPPSGDQYISELVGGPALVDALGEAGDTGIAVRMEAGHDRSTLLAAGFAERIVIDVDAQARAIGSGTDNDSLMLVVVAWLGAIGGILVLAPVVARVAVAAQADADRLRTLGFTRSDLLRRAGLHGTALGLSCGLVAVVTAAALSLLSPIAEARRFEPAPGVDVDVAIVGLGAAVVVVAILLVVIVSIWRATAATRRDPRPRSSVLARVLGSRRIGPVGSLGLRMGFGSTARGANSGYFVAIALGAAVVTAALTFTSGLAELEANPRLVGMNYDVLIFAPDDVDDSDEWAMTRSAALRARPDVAAASAGTYYPNALVVLGPQAVDAFVVSYESGPGALEPVVVEGRAPTAPHEILVHPSLLSDVGEIGDTVVARADHAQGEGPGSDSTMITTADFTIVGSGIVAVEGMFKSSAVITSDGLRRLYGPEFADAAGAHLVQARFVDDIAVAEGVAALDRDGLVDGFSVVATDGPAVETDVRVAVSGARGLVRLDLDGLEMIPRVLAALLGFLAACVLAIMMIERTHSWSRRCAIHRALGITTWQVFGAVVVAALATSAGAALVGAPFGLVSGRALWSRHAENLGALSDGTVPVAAALAVCVGALVAAFVIALRPARLAGRAPIAPALRAE